MDNTAAALTQPLRDLDARYALNKDLLAQEVGLTREQVQRVFDGDTDCLSHILAVAEKLGYVVLAVARPAAPVVAAGHEVTEPAVRTRVAAALDRVRARKVPDDLLDIAARVLGGEQVREWLHQPQVALEGQVPAELARTPQGAEQVRELLLRLDGGVYT